MRGVSASLFLCKNIILTAVVSSVVFVSFVSAQAVSPDLYKGLVPPHPNQLGWQPTSTECSLTDRGNQSNTVVSLYDLTDPDWLNFITIRNPDVSTAGNILGTIPWYKNNYGNGATNANCDNANPGHGSWTQSEKDAWTSFWGSQGHLANMDRVFSANTEYQSNRQDPLQPSGPINSLGIRWMQVYITWACGFPLKADGRIGIKTLNAVKYCQKYANFKPGFYWYLQQYEAGAIDKIKTSEECILRDKIDFTVLASTDYQGTSLTITDEQFEEKYGVPLCPSEPGICTGNCKPEFVSQFGTGTRDWMTPMEDAPENCCVDLTKMIPGLPAEFVGPTNPSTIAKFNEDYPDHVIAEIIVKMSRLNQVDTEITFCPHACDASCAAHTYLNYKLYLKELGGGKCCLDKQKVEQANLSGTTLINDIAAFNEEYGFEPSAGPMELCDEPNSCTFSVPQKTALTNLNTPEKTIFDPEKCCLTVTGTDVEKVNIALAIDPNATVQTYDASKHKCPEVDQNACITKWGALYDTVKADLDPTTCCLTTEEYEKYKKDAGSGVPSPTGVANGYTLAQLEDIVSKAKTAGNSAVCDGGKCELEGNHVITTEAGGCECEKPYEKSDKDPKKCVKKCNIDTCECGIKLNTRVPWIGRCIMFGNTNNTNDIEFVGLNEDGVNIVINPLNAFPVLATALTRIGMTFFLLLSFASLIVAGVLMTMSGATGGSTYSRGKDLIWKVAISIALIGLIGAILNAINPNFFTLG